MADVQKGVVVTAEAEGVRVRTFGSGDAVSPLLNDGGYSLQVGDIVALAIFDDNTGIILGKM